jgi:MFS transporter, FHS family, L-fucose permease
MGAGHLLLVAAGCAMFYPAAKLISYPLFLVALFIVGIGFAILQIAANPYVTILGPERTASSRLNLSQAFNSLGYTIGSPLAGWLIFIVLKQMGEQGAESAKIPYLCFAGAFLILALFFLFAHLPNFTNKEHIARGAGALKHPHMVLGVIAIFLYVGAEVTIGSSIVNYLGLPKLGGLTHAVASSFLPFYWGGAMIGRFMGAFALSDIRKWLRHLIVALLPAAAFITIWLFFGHANAFHYGILLAIMMAAFFLSESSPHRMLVLFSLIIIALLLTGILSAGATAKWAILGIGLFNSVMWSNIFSMAIEGLGEFKSQGSSLLVMAIFGGALLPPLQGIVADWKGLQFSFIVPIASYIYIAFYGLYGYRAGRRMNTDSAAVPADAPVHVAQ